ncbi:MAG: NAD(P)-dependent oxidoreductase [Deltaproteobacteria bacterium]|nr:NAD(P)-dependent oxidoreductase [Deltaproteobacteria bacterium]
MIKKIGFIGLGTIGKPVAINLAQKGYSLNVFDIQSRATEDLKEMGVQMASSPAEAVHDRDMVILILPEKDEKNRVLPGSDGLLDNIAPETLLVDLGSHSLEATLELAAEAEKRQVPFLDAPVWGTRDRAIDGLVTLLAGGPAEHLSRAREAFSSFALNIIHVGDIGDGTRMKFIVDMLQAQLAEALAEGLLLGEKLGFKPDKVLEVLDAGTVNSPLFHTKGRAISRGDFTRNLALKYIYGNLLYVKNFSHQAGIKLPAAETVLEVFAEAVQKGYGEEDYCAVAKVLKNMPARD